MTNPDRQPPDASGPGEPFIPLLPDAGQFRPDLDGLPAEFPVPEPSIQE